VKKILYAVALVMVWTVAAQAAVIYLKGGGQIKAKKIWREKGKVVVLVNRDSITTFANSELNLKKTFPPRKKRVKPAAVTPSAPLQGGSAAAVEQPDKSEKKFALPSLPHKLPEKDIPKATEEGTLRKQKREMEERLKD
jgi:hypothetical protein